MIAKEQTALHVPGVATADILGRSDSLLPWGTCNKPSMVAISPAWNALSSGMGRAGSLQSLNLSLNQLIQVYPHPRT